MSKMKGFYVIDRLYGTSEQPLRGKLIARACRERIGIKDIKGKSEPQVYSKAFNDFVDVCDDSVLFLHSGNRTFENQNETYPPNEDPYGNADAHKLFQHIAKLKKNVIIIGYTGGGEAKPQWLTPNAINNITCYFKDRVHNPSDLHLDDLIPYIFTEGEIIPDELDAILQHGGFGSALKTVNKINSKLDAAKSLIEQGTSLSNELDFIYKMAGKAVGVDASELKGSLAKIAVSYEELRKSQSTEGAKADMLTHVYELSRRIDRILECIKKSDAGQSVDDVKREILGWLKQ